MRPVPVLLTAALLAACAPKEKAPAAMTLADFAGTWQVTSMVEGSANPVTSTMSGTADPTSWTLTLEGRPVQPITVTIVGDSLIGQTGEFESILRPGVMVSTRTASMLGADGKLTGNLVATYKTAKGTEAVKGTTTATKTK